MSTLIDELLKQADNLTPYEKIALANKLIAEAHSSSAPTEQSHLSKQSERHTQHLNWLKNHQVEFAGKYVALDGDKLIAAGSSYR